MIDNLISQVVNRFKTHSLPNVNINGAENEIFIMIFSFRFHSYFSHIYLLLFLHFLILTRRLISDILPSGLLLDFPLVPIFGGQIPPLSLPSSSSSANEIDKKKDKENEKNIEKLSNKKTIDSNFLFFRMVNTHIKACGKISTSLSTNKNIISLTEDDNEVAKGISCIVHTQNEVASASGNGSLVRTSMFSVLYYKKLNLT